MRRANNTGTVTDPSNLKPTNEGRDSLPKLFVNSMKTLFDIMDDQNTGLIKLSDIEEGWLNEGDQGVPSGVVESLRKVTPVNGLLTFERFCTGLKICLLRNQAEENNRKDNTNLRTSSTVEEVTSKALRSQTASANIDMQALNNWAFNTAAVRPNNAVQSLHSHSLPQLGPTASELQGPPPKPPRSAMPASLKTGIDKAEIRNALQNWQMGVLMNGMETKNRNFASPARGTADGGSAAEPTSQQKKTTNKKREPRRHTLQNGIDNKLLKRLKLFEAEKDVLLQGLTAVEQARDWYLQQIGIVQEKIKFLAHSASHVEQWSEAHQERLDFQRARIIEINRHLSALWFSWERGGFPSHMNLAVHTNHRTRHQALSQESESLN